MTINILNPILVAPPFTLPSVPVSGGNQGFLGLLDFVGYPVANGATVPTTTRGRYYVAGRRLLIQYLMMREQQRESLHTYLVRLAKKKATDEMVNAKLAVDTKVAQAKELATSNMYSVLLAEI